MLNPAGDVAVQQRDLVLIATALMLLIIIPVMALTVLFAWRYRKSNTEAEYDPEFDHSTMLELVIWSAPLLIIICLGAVTWTSTHLLDPYRPIERTAPGQPIASNVKPLEVQVVALDWKWLFIYPEQGIATVNELALPVDRPVEFRLTGTSVMNAFYIPAMAGMIYTMPGMETKLHAVLNREGTFKGLSSHYSGAGFSGMHFPVFALQSNGFDQWVEKVRTSQAGQGKGGSADPRRLPDRRKAQRICARHVFQRGSGRPVRPCRQPLRRGQHALHVGRDDARPDDRGGDPHKMKVGEGNPPVNNTGPMHGERTKGALEKSPSEIEVSPHQSLEPTPSNGVQEPVR